MKGSSCAKCGYSAGKGKPAPPSKGRGTMPPQFLKKGSK